MNATFWPSESRLSMNWQASRRKLACDSASVRPGMATMELGANRPSSLVLTCPLPISPGGADWK
jgi:hypothetical protein